MKKTIVVFLMMCSTVQARLAVGLTMPRVKATGVNTHVNSEAGNMQKATNTEKPTGTASISIEEHIYAVTNDAFAKIKLVWEQ